MIEDEELIPLCELPHRLPRRNGKQINISTIYRWRNRGLHGVRLEIIYRLGQPCTSLEALKRFDVAVTAAIEGPKVGGIQHSNNRQAHELAKRKLAKKLSS